MRTPVRSVPRIVMSRLSTVTLSGYTPGEINTMSPALAFFTARVIVAASAGTRITRPAAVALLTESPEHPLTTAATATQHPAIHRAPRFVRMPRRADPGRVMRRMDEQAIDRVLRGPSTTGPIERPKHSPYRDQ